MWTPTHGNTSVDRSAKIYCYHLCEDSGYRLLDLTRVMVDRDGWWEIESRISVPSACLDDDDIDDNDDIYISNEIKVFKTPVIRLSWCCRTQYRNKTSALIYDPKLHLMVRLHSWFGSVSFFNGISNFVGYLMPKPSFKKNSSCIM